MKLLTKRKKNRIISELGHLAAIQNDYIREPDGKNAATLLIDISKAIGGEKAANKMVTEAEYYASLRKGQTKSAENSSTRVEDSKTLKEV